MSFLELCENIEDNRIDINKHYDLLDIIFLTMSAVLSVPFYPESKVGRPYISLALLNLSGSGSTVNLPMAFRHVTQLVASSGA
jgi:hypothetical protein